MGRGWRRLSESWRQTLAPVTDKEFQATSNARNEAMLKDAARFSLHIRTMEKDLLGIQKQVAGQFDNLRDILMTYLPRVWDYSRYDPTSIEARGEPVEIGKGINMDGLQLAQDSLKKKLEDEVFLPMREWANDYAKIQLEMKKLEALRLELDSRRRTVGELDHKLSMLRDKNMRLANIRQGGEQAPPGSTLVSHMGPQDTGDASDPKAQALAKLIDETTAKKAHKEEKLRDIQNSFQELEVVVFNSLETLIIDAASLRHYAGCALSIIQECFATSSRAFEATNIASMDFSTTAPQQEHQYAPAAAGPDRDGGDQSMLRTIANKLTGRNGAPYAVREQGPSNGGGFDAAPTGKIAPPVMSAADHASVYIQRSGYVAAGPSGRMPHGNNAGWSMQGI